MLIIPIKQEKLTFTKKKQKLFRDDILKKNKSKQIKTLPQTISTSKQSNKILISRNMLGNAKDGETWVINDGLTRGHKSLIVRNNKADKRKGVVKHLPITHSPKTRKMRNIELKENPDSSDVDKNKKVRTSYVLSNIQESSAKAKAKKKENIKIKNPIDKSIRRHLKKNNKKSKDVDE